MRAKISAFTLLPFIIGLLITASLLWPLFVAPFFTHHDDVQVIRTHQMVKCFYDLQFPCRWVPDLGGLYGYPLFNYYAPLPYYISGMVFLITGSYIFAAKFLFGAAFLLSYIFMFLLGRKLWGNWGGLISGVLYSLSPYHALDMYVRGAMGELWGIAFFPAVLWALLRIYEKRSLINLGILGICFSLLVLSHNLSAMIFFGVLLVIILFILLFGNLQDKKSKVQFLLYSLVGVVIGFMLSGFYWIPALVEKDLVHVDTTTYGYFSYTEHFKGLRKVIFDRSWGWGASVREVPGGERDGMSFQIGWIHLFFVVLGLLAAFLFRKKEKFYAYFILLFFVLMLVSIFMIHPRSEFLWKLFDPLKYLQFPWRFLMLVIFFVSVIGGSVSLLIEKGDYVFRFSKKWLYILLIIPVFLLNFMYFQPEKFIQTNDETLLSGKDWDKQIKRSIFDYLPKSATEPPAELATVRYEILTPNPVFVDSFYEGTDWFTMNVKTSGHTIIRFSQYYFPGWQIKVNGAPVTIDANNNLGLMTIIVGTGDYKIEGKLYNTVPRVFGNVITISGLVLLFGIFLLTNGKAKKWFGYYLRSVKR